MDRRSTQRRTHGGRSAGPASDARALFCRTRSPAIERLQARLDAAESAQREPIAIVGMACRLPGGVDDAEALWQLLRDGRDAVGEVPADRWDVDAYYDPDPEVPASRAPRPAASSTDVDGFEPAFFGISPREARLDPQQRLLLEVAWEALEDAGVPRRPAGRQPDRRVRRHHVDRLRAAASTSPIRRAATSTWRPARRSNAAAGRVSFTLGLQGPCMAIDTACSSSLVAIHLACQSLRTGESDLALAGGVNVDPRRPTPFVLISKWGMLAPDGRCKTFDASADGFVRGEGCGMSCSSGCPMRIANGRNDPRGDPRLGDQPGRPLERADRAERPGAAGGRCARRWRRARLAAGRRQLRRGARHRHVARRSDRGRGARRGLRRGPRDGRSRSRSARSRPTSATSRRPPGVAGLIKVVLALQHRQLPASLHVKTADPGDSAGSGSRCASAPRCTTGSRRAARAVAGVSSFGFSGTNAHVVVEEAPAARRRQRGASARRTLLPLSAQSERGAGGAGRRAYAAHLSATPTRRSPTSAPPPRPARRTSRIAWR